MRKSFICLLSILLISCIGDQYYTLFNIKNNSGKNLYYTYSPDYPDTSISNIPYIPGGSIRTPSELISPGETLPELTSIPAEDYFKAMRSDTIEVFIYDAKLVQTTPWDEIISKYLILKRYDLTLDSIKKMGGIIDYP